MLNDKLYRPSKISKIIIINELLINCQRKLATHHRRRLIRYPCIRKCVRHLSVLSDKIQQIIFNSERCLNMYRHNLTVRIQIKQANFP